MHKNKKFLKKLKKQILYLTIFIVILIITTLLNYLSNSENVNNLFTNTLITEKYDNNIKNKNIYFVTRVIDGDTIEVKSENEEISKVRVIGINAPEINDERERVRCLAQLAKNKAKELALNKKVKLNIDPSQEKADRFGRLLRYIELEDGRDFGLVMIKEGYAYEFTFRLPYQKQQIYKQAQKYAENNKKGLWNLDICKEK